MRGVGGLELGGEGNVCGCGAEVAWRVEEAQNAGAELIAGRGWRSVVVGGSTACWAGVWERARGMKEG